MYLFIHSITKRTAVLKWTFQWFDKISEIELEHNIYNLMRQLRSNIEYLKFIMTRKQNWLNALPTVIGICKLPTDQGYSSIAAITDLSLLLLKPRSEKKSKDLPMRKSINKHGWFKLDFEIFSEGCLHRFYAVCSSRLKSNIHIKSWQSVVLIGGLLSWIFQREMSNISPGNFTHIKTCDAFTANFN